jgi:hypothetical protein
MLSWKCWVKHGRKYGQNNSRNGYSPKVFA